MHKTVLSVALAFYGILVLTNHAAGQIHSTITCQPGEWDVLSIFVMDDGLSANNHMEGLRADGHTAYKFTHWKPAENKVNYVKHPQGNPWDVFLYDQKYIYHWITEVSGAEWNNPYHYKKNNNGLGQPDSDYSFKWVARCAVPGSSSFWITGQSGQQYNTRFQIHDDPSQNNTSCAQTGETALGLAFLELKALSTDTIIDTRDNGYSNPVTTLPLQYTYNCDKNNLNTCRDREVFTFAVDTNVNHFDGVKHSYGWIRWRQYSNSAYPNGQSWGNPVNWAFTDKVVQTMGSQGEVVFPCF